MLRASACDPHDVGRWTACPQLRGHELHKWINVVKEVLIGGTKIVQPCLSVWSLEKTMLRALSIAGKSYVAFPAHAGKQVLLVATEFRLLLRADHLLQVDFRDVPEFVFGVDEMIAGIEISGMFHGKSRSARLAKYTQTRIQAEPALERNVE